MKINNESISFAAERVYANSHLVQVDIPMAGRVEQYHALTEAFASKRSSIVTLTAPLGGGKTFLIEKVIGEQIELGFPEHVNRRTIFASEEESGADSLIKRLDNWSSKASEDHPRVVVVEELDRKGEFIDLLWTVTESVRWLESHAGGLLILSGDRFIEHPAVMEIIRESGLPTIPLTLEPLDRELMVEAMALRFARFILPDETPESMTIARSSASSVLADVAVETSVLPPSCPPVSNFREAFGLLKNLSDYVARDSDAISLPSGLLRHVVRDSRLTADQRCVEEWILERTRDALQSGKVVTPFHEHELRTDPPTAMAPTVFRHSVLEPLVRLQILTPMGIPFLQEHGSDPEYAFPGPFLPRQDAYIRAWMKGLQG